MAMPTVSGQREYEKFTEDQFGNTTINVNIPTETAGTQKHIIHQFLSTNGDGTGTIIGTGNFSDAGSGATEFTIEPGAGEIFRITRMIVHISDEGVINTADKYGNIDLTNGIAFTSKTTHHPTEEDLLGGLPIMTTWDWGRYCYDVSGTDYTTNLNVFQARWTFAKAGQLVRLVGDNSDFIKITLNDDFSGLVDHSFQIQGYIE